MYKMAKKWDEAGKTFCKIATVHIGEGNKHDAATNYVDAANCYKKNAPNEAASCLQSAIDIYTDMGRFTIAAKHHQVTFIFVRWNFSHPTTNIVELRVRFTFRSTP